MAFLMEGLIPKSLLKRPLKASAAVKTSVSWRSSQKGEPKTNEQEV